MNAPSVIGANAYAQAPPANHIALIREFISANPKIFIFYVLFLLVLPLQDVGMPHLYGKIVQQIQNKQAYGKTFVWVVSIIVIIQIINSMLDFEEMRFQPKMVEFIHTRIIRHLFGEYSTSLDDLKTGELFSKMIKLPFALYDYLEIWRYFILPQLLVYTITGFYLYSKDPAIGVMFGVMMSVVAFMIFTIPNMCKRVSMLRDENFNQLNERIDEMLKNMPAILNAGTYEKEEAVLRGFQAQYSEYTKKSMMCMIYCKMVFIVVYLAFILFFFWRCYTQIKAGRMQAGSFVALFTIMMYTTNSMWKIVYQIKDVIFRIGTIKESMKVFDRLEKPEQRMPDAADAAAGGGAGGAAAEGTGALRMTNVTFKYPKIADAVIEKMNLTVRRGERVLLVGRIGSGKSTVLKLLMKYHLPHEGTIYLDGTPYAAISEEALRARIGYVPQTPILFDRTVYENINYGAREVSRAEILALVETLRMEDTFAKFKEGLDTEVGKNGGRISGGQRQILWLFRVILQNPEVVLLDEPTASIDAETKEAVQRLLEYAMKGRTVVGVTHDPFLHKHATRIVTMDNGKIIKDSASEAQAGWGRDRA